jgi:hypothetical protein
MYYINLLFQPSQTLTIIQPRTKTIFQQVLTNLQVNVNEKNEIIKSRNVYNKNTKFKYEISDNLTSIKIFIEKAFFSRIMICEILLTC